MVVIIGDIATVTRLPNPYMKLIFITRFGGGACHNSEYGFSSYSVRTHYVNINYCIIDKLRIALYKHGINCLAVICLYKIKVII